MQGLQERALGHEAPDAGAERKQDPDRDQGNGGLRGTDRMITRGSQIDQRHHSRADQGRDEATTRGVVAPPEEDGRDHDE